jgi:hypothetical protein
MSKKGKKKKKASLKVLQKKSTRLIRQEYMDYDYVDQLSKEEKQWLADFTAEYYNASVGRQGDEGKDNRFARSKKEVKDSQHRNNLVNNDTYSKKRAHRDLIFSNNEGVIDPQVRNKWAKQHSYEDALVEILDHKREKLSNSSEDTDDQCDES